GASVGAVAAEPSVDAQKTDAVAIEVVQDPKIIRWPKGDIYPTSELLDGREGWVIFTLMVDSTGKPHDPMVTDSSGNPAFERAVLRWLDTVTFEPARRNGMPVDASFTNKMKFAVAGLAKAASPEFVSTYKRFVKAVEAHDKTTADEQLARLVPRNLYEEAYANLGKYYYHVAWGMPSQQREDLTAAIAGESQPTYLPKDLFVKALFTKFKFEMEAFEYGTALETWKVLEPLASAEMQQNLKRVIEEIHAIQAGDQPLRISGVVNDRSRWNTWLLRNRFNVAVKDGSISDVKLNSARKSMAFKFEPEMQSTIAYAKTPCQVLLLGQPGKTFDLNQ